MQGTVYDVITDDFVPFGVPNGQFQFGEGEDKNMNGKVEPTETSASEGHFDSDSDGLLDGWDISSATVIEAYDSADIMVTGAGYFTFRFTEVVGAEGCVYALDVDRDYLAFIEEERRRRGLDNIKIILVREEGVDAELKNLDIIFLRNVYHHLKDRVNYFFKLRNSLKPGGSMVIIDYTERGGFNYRGLFGHHIQAETVIEELRKAGYNMVAVHDILTEQSFLVFSLASSSSEKR